MPRFPNINFPFPYYNNRRFPTPYPYTPSEFNRLNFENSQSKNYNSYKNNSENLPASSTENEITTQDSQNRIFESKKNKSNNFDNDFLFDLFGLKIYTDDVLLVSLIYFLYSEGVKDEGLFIVLILLLLS